MKGRRGISVVLAVLLVLSSIGSVAMIAAAQTVDGQTEGAILVTDKYSPSGTHIQARNVTDGTTIWDNVTDSSGTGGQIDYRESNNKLYQLSNGDNTMRIYDRNGTQVDSYPVDDSTPYDFQIMQGTGHGYLSNTNNEVIKFDIETGNIINSRVYPDRTRNIDVANGHIYVTTSGGYAQKLNPDMTIETEYQFSSGTSYTITVDEDAGYVYTQSEGTVSKFNEGDATQIWSNTVSSARVTGLNAKHPDGHLYANDQDGDAYRLDPSDGSTIWNNRDSNGGSEIAITPQGNIAMALNDYAVKYQPDGTQLFQEYVGDYAIYEMEAIGEYVPPPPKGEYDPQLELRLENPQKPNSTFDYGVAFQNENGQYTDVTDNTTVTSSNTTYAEVNTQNNTITTFENGGNVTIEAVYTTEAGNEYTTNETLQIRDPTLENLKYFDQVERFTIVLGNIPVIAMLMLLGLSAALGSVTGSKFASVLAFTFGCILLWALGYATVGIVLITLPAGTVILSGMVRARGVATQ